jgi:hypothetical protein
MRSSSWGEVVEVLDALEAGSQIEIESDHAGEFRFN